MAARDYEKIHEALTKHLHSEKNWVGMMEILDPFASDAKLDITKPVLSAVISGESSLVATASRMWFKEVWIPYIKMDAAGVNILTDLIQATLERMEKTFDLYNASSTLKGCAKDWKQAVSFSKLVLDSTVGTEFQDRVKCHC